MKLFEHEAKNILKKYGILTPLGKVVGSPAEAEVTAAEIGGPVVLKSQVLVSGRGKSGGILFAADSTKAKEIAAGLIGNEVKGLKVNKLLVEEKIDIAEESPAAGQYDSLIDDI